MKNLEIVTANMMALFLLAKKLHLNVTGPRFYGDHKTYDGIAEMAIGWYDVLAERMRALEAEVVSSPEWVEEASMMEDIDADDSAEDMAAAMLASLEELSAFIGKNAEKLDATTANMLQELDAEIGKHAYFVRSSI